MVTTALFGLGGRGGDWETGGARTEGRGIRMGDARIRDDLGEVVLGSVEEASNAVLDADAEQLCGAGRTRGVPRGACRQP